MNNIKHTLSIAIFLIYSSIAFSQSIKIATFNVEWLGCPENGPSNETLQMQNVATIIKNVDADIVALQEITMNPINSLDVVLSYLGSDWGGYVREHTYGTSCFQDMGIIYKKAAVSLTSSALIGSGWARNPALYSMSVTKDGANIPLEIVNIHAKAYADEASYNTRVNNSRNLKNVLDGNTYNKKNIVIIGDYNDYLNGTQCTTKTDSPYKNFVDDATNYKPLTINLSRTIDNIMISNELVYAYVANSATRETAVTSTVSNYRNTTSDHTPVSITLNFNSTAAPKNTYSTQIALYPNPTQHTLNVESMAGSIASVRVCNINGVVIYEQKNINAPLLNISTSAWQKGLYIVTVYSEKSEVGSKMILKN